MFNNMFHKISSAVFGEKSCDVCDKLSTIQLILHNILQYEDNPSATSVEYKIKIVDDIEKLKSIFKNIYYACDECNFLLNPLLARLTELARKVESNNRGKMDEESEKLQSLFRETIKNKNNNKELMCPGEYVFCYIKHWLEKHPLDSVHSLSDTNSVVSYIEIASALINDYCQCDKCELYSIYLQDRMIKILQEVRNMNQDSK